MRLNLIIFDIPLQFTVMVFVTFVVFTGLKCEAADYDVIILGAGLSGITAAKHLHESGIQNFMVLEAQDYVGGRLKNTNIKGITFGEGANWVHHVEDGATNPLFMLYQAAKLQGHQSDEDDVAVKPIGNKIAYEEAVENIDLVSKEVQKSKQQQQDEPLRSAFQANGWRADTALKSAVEWFLYDYEYAVKTDMISTRHHDGLPKENIIVTDPKGYAEVINYLKRNFGGNIQIGAVVKKITNLNTGDVEIITSQGKENKKYLARYVLCTFSTGVLGSNLVTFEPELPMWKKNAIARIPLAYYTHVLVEFPLAFWDNNEFLIETGTVRGQFPVIYNLNKEGLHPKSNLLLFTAVSDDSLRIENQDDAKTKDEVKKTLTKMYPNTKIPDPTAIFISKWSNNPYIKGSYSNAVVGSTADDFANLMGRVGNVFFAGEACDEKYWGYLQGAYRTGLAQAKVIIDCVNGKDCPEYKPKLI